MTASLTDLTSPLAQHRPADEGRIADVGMDIDLWRIDVPALSADPEFPGMEAPRDEAYGLATATSPSSARRTASGASSRHGWSRPTRRTSP